MGFVKKESISDETPSAGSSVLAESMGKSIDNTGEWYYVSGDSDLLWERSDYGDVEAASDGQTQSHEAVRLGRYLSITTNYGNIIDG